MHSKQGGTQKSFHVLNQMIMVSSQQKTMQLYNNNHIFMMNNVHDEYNIWKIRILLWISIYQWATKSIVLAWLEETLPPRINPPRFFCVLVFCCFPRGDVFANDLSGLNQSWCNCFFPLVFYFLVFSGQNWFSVSQQVRLHIGSGFPQLCIRWLFLEDWGILR